MGAGAATVLREPQIAPRRKQSRSRSRQPHPAQPVRLGSRRASRMRARTFFITTNSWPGGGRLRSQPCRRSGGPGRGVVRVVGCGGTWVAPFHAPLRCQGNVAHAPVWCKCLRGIFSTLATPLADTTRPIATITPVAREQPNRISFRESNFVAANTTVLFRLFRAGAGDCTDGLPMLS
jgi:hypothetical protein